ncbi:MAG: tetratricopeptide repeat protein [Candidatus Aminicenantaceae bacterium]
MKKVMFFLILTFMVTLFVFPQTYKGKARIMGYVYDEQGQPIEGVRVKLFSLNAQDGFEVKTDANGKWVASWIRGGGWNIDFEKMGYVSEHISYNVKTFGRNPEIEITMKEIEGLVVTEDIQEELGKGNDLFNEGKYEEALEVYEKILVDYPDAYVINKNIGNCYFQQEKFELAEKYYKKVLEIDPENNEIKMDIGNCYANRGFNEQALEWYNKVDFKEIKNVTVLFNIGTNLFNSRDYEEALKYYQRAVEIQEDFLDAIYQLGVVYLSLQDNDKAIRAFERYLELDSDSAKADQVRNFLEYLKK